MDIEHWLRTQQKALSTAGISTARLDSLVLLEDTIGKNRAWLLSHPERILSNEERTNLDFKITQRCSHMPLAYIRGKTEFYGRTFMVTPQTLVPRPETETMIELLKKMDVPQGARILDIGTGSGCIAVTAALELTHVTVSAVDIDTDCLAVANANAKVLGAHVSFFESDLLEHAQPCDILLANLPYVPDDFQINTAATHEPKRAIFGGTDGLNLYRNLFTQLSSSSQHPQYVITESLPIQHEKLANIAKVAGFRLQKTDDFIQLYRSL